MIFEHFSDKELTWPKHVNSSDKCRGNVTERKLKIFVELNLVNAMQ